MGAVTNVVRRYVPASYLAMVGSTNPYYSSSDLQSLADFIQYRLFSTVVGATAEASSYDIEQIELLGMLSTLQFIPAAVEYWGDQLQSESTTGTHEQITWFDRRDQLWKLFDRLKNEADQLAIDLGIPISNTAAFVPRVTYGDNGRNILKTSDPQRWPRLIHQHHTWWPANDPGA